MTRVVSHLQLKALDSEQRILEGWASTPEFDRMGDIVQSSGATYKLPLPLLMDHDHKAAVGEVFSATVTDAGIRFKAKIAKIEEPGSIKDLCDCAWSAAKAGLRRAVSIGFLPLERVPLKSGGWHFKAWQWTELSLVTVPACQGATIDQIKSIDRNLRANIKQTSRVIRLTDNDYRKAGIIRSQVPLADAVLAAASNPDNKGLSELTGASLAAIARTGDQVLADIRERLAKLEPQD